MINTHNKLINYLIERERLKSKSVINAFKEADRKWFVLPEYRDQCYEDKPLTIGSGQTISQPTTVAIMMEALGVQRGDHVLDIGSGSGWTTVLLGYQVGPNGSVIGIERQDSLIELGTNNIAKFSQLPIHINSATKSIGIPEKRFDKILVSAAGTCVPEDLLNQLNVQGCCVIPIQNDIYIITKDEKNNVSTTYLRGFSFVPLIL